MIAVEILFDTSEHYLRFTAFFTTLSMITVVKCDSFIVK